MREILQLAGLMLLFLLLISSVFVLSGWLEQRRADREFRKRYLLALERRSRPRPVARNWTAAGRELEDDLELGR